MKCTFSVHELLLMTYGSLLEYTGTPLDEGQKTYFFRMNQDLFSTVCISTTAVLDFLQILAEELNVLATTVVVHRDLNSFLNRD